MKHKKRGTPVVTTITILLGVLILIAVIWGIKTVVVQLSHYGESTTVQTEKEEPVKGEKPAEEVVRPEDHLPRNQYDPDGFSEENGILTYEKDGVRGIAGIDVSSYQPKIDWEKVKAAGIEYAIIQLGYRGYVSGELHLDECFLKHMRDAEKAGVRVGVYFFSQALTPEEAVEEAEYVITWLEGYEITCPVYFDWEEVEGQARTDHMNMLMLTSCAEAFCRTIEEAGYEAGIYFNQSYGYEQLNLVSLKDYTFWLAEYAEAPSFAYHFDMWQYTNNGRVDGIEEQVDLNIWFEQ